MLRGIRKKDGGPNGLWNTTESCLTREKREETQPERRPLYS